MEQVNGLLEVDFLIQPKEEVTFERLEAGAVCNGQYTNVINASNEAGALLNEGNCHSVLSQVDQL